MFEHTLVRRQRSRRWWVTLGAAVAAHAVALGALLLASSWSVEAMEPPLVSEVFQVVLPPPDLGGSPPTPAPQPQPPPQPAATVTPVQPPEVPDAPPVPDSPPLANTTPSVASTASGPPADDVATNPAGVPWGVAGGPGDADSPGDDQTARPLDARMTRPETLVRVQPRYTERARAMHLEGIVVLQATIDRTGSVIDVRLVKSLGLGLDEEAISAVRQWRFRPATLLGRPVPVYFQLTVRFTIS